MGGREKRSLYSAVLTVAAILLCLCPGTASAEEDQEVRQGIVHIRAELSNEGKTVLQREGTGFCLQGGSGGASDIYVVTTYGAVFTEEEQDLVQKKLEAKADKNQRIQVQQEYTVTFKEDISAQASRIPSDSFIRQLVLLKINLHPDHTFLLANEEEVIPQELFLYGFSGRNGEMGLFSEDNIERIPCKVLSGAGEKNSIFSEDKEARIKIELPAGVLEDKGLTGSPLVDQEGTLWGVFLGPQGNASSSGEAVPVQSLTELLAVQGLIPPVKPLLVEKKRSRLVFILFYAVIGMAILNLVYFIAYRKSGQIPSSSKAKSGQRKKTGARRK